MNEFRARSDSWLVLLLLIKFQFELTLSYLRTLVESCASKPVSSVTDSERTSKQAEDPALDDRASIPPLLLLVSPRESSQICDIRKYLRTSMSEESTDPLPHNHALAEHLRAIAYYEELYQVKNYEWRAASYVTAASLISKLGYELLTAQEARSYRGIGPKISKRVEQFSLTGTSTKLEKLRARDSARDEVISTLSNVVGISVNMANELYEGGVRSLSDLRDNSSQLERVGLSPIYLENAQRLLELIPREESGTFREQVRALLASTRWNITVTSTGAYRRSEPATSIDLLLTHSSPAELKVKHVMTHLSSLIGRYLSLSVSHFSGLSLSRRHITVRLVREESYATALLHTTGPIPFVYDVRVLEQGLSRHLNEYELITRSGKNITPTTERAVFSSVDMDYVPATRRE